jgi:hypothetical protein
MDLVLRHSLGSALQEPLDVDVDNPGKLSRRHNSSLRCAADHLSSTLNKQSEFNDDSLISSGLSCWGLCVSFGGLIEPLPEEWIKLISVSRTFLYGERLQRFNVVSTPLSPTDSPAPSA